MSIKRSLKKILFLMPKSVRNRFYLIYNHIFYSESTEKKCSFGLNNGDKIFYVIRPRSNSVEGLMALFLYVLQQISYAEQKGYIPIVDFENYDTQYTDTIDGKKNSWEFYFEQISEYNLEQVYMSKNVILSGINATQESYNFLAERSFKIEDIFFSHKLINKYIRLSENVQKLLSDEKLDIRYKRLGLYLRGTDYVKLKPTGESVQPTVEMVINKADELMVELGLKKVFLVTEDAQIYEKIRNHYGDKLETVSFDRYIDKYDGKNFLANNDKIMELSESPYKRGLYYLVKILLLSQCACIVGGKTCGSWAACCFADNNVRKEIFDLGIY